MKWFLIVGMIVAFVMIGSSAAIGKTIVVDDDEGEWMEYRWIQDAINNSTSGDTIRVYNGTYYGYHDIDVAVAIIGNGSDDTLVDAYRNWSGFHVNSNGVTIDGFTITGTRNEVPDDPGIYIEWADNINITNCTIHSTRYGIYVNDTRYLNVSDSVFYNITFDTGSAGIYMYHNIQDVNILNCTVNGSNNGFVLRNGGNVSISECDIWDIEGYGIRIDRWWETPDNITIDRFEHQDIDNDYSKPAIELEARYSTLSNTTVNNVSGWGLGLNIKRCVVFNCTVNLTTNWTIIDATDSTIMACSFKNSTGTSLRFYGDNNHIVRNTFRDSQYGLFMTSDTDNNMIHHNNFINHSRTPQASDSSGNNQWDNGSAGNYWDDYNGSDSNGDGIGDTSYEIGGGNAEDRYPLMEAVDETPLEWIPDVSLFMAVSAVAVISVAFISIRRKRY
jgi:parallel beta-helix repeat protein